MGKPLRLLLKTVTCFRGQSGKPRPDEMYLLTFGMTGGGQQLHIIYVEGFEVSPFEGEFGRHLAILHPAGDMASLKERLQAAGTQAMLPMRPSSVDRFFFRDPVNGYVFEVIEAIHLDQ